MTAARIMHVDDEPDIREVVRISLGLDPDLTVRSCASGAEALAEVGVWSPDLVLLDVMMPEMDGPTTLAKLRGDRGTATIPVVFMTARVQSRELDYFKSLGAAGVLAKPFDPCTLAESLREFLRPKPLGLDDMQAEFLGRARREGHELAACKTALATGLDRADVLARTRKLAHGLAGAGGIFGFREISTQAAALEDVLIAGASEAEVGQAIDELLGCIAKTIGEQADTFSQPPSVTSH